MAHEPYLDTTDDNAWRYLQCFTVCGRYAEILVEDTPFCIDCATEQLEYDIATTFLPDLLFMLNPPHLRD